MTDQTWAWVSTVALVAIWATVLLVVAVLIFGPIFGAGRDEPVLTPPAPPCRLDSPGVCPGGGQ